MKENRIVSCIIPAHNEASRIARVLEVVANHPLLREVVVIDDASEDSTSEVVQRFANIRLITLKKNVGKSKAICEGLSKITGEYVILLDADLLGLTATDVTTLIKPVLDGVADISISLRGNSPLFWRIIGLDYISGERVLRKSFLLNHVEDIRKLSGFGLETFMNQLIVSQHLKIKVVELPKIASPWKYEKAGFFSGVWADVKMLGDIFKTTSAPAIVMQIIRMLRLRV